MWGNQISIDHLVGETIVEIKVDDETYTGELIFICESGRRFKLYHEQDCCESVILSDVVGDFADLLNTPVLVAEEVTNSDGDYSLSVEHDPLTGDNAIREIAANTTQEQLDDLQQSRREFMKKNVGYESTTWTFYRIATRKGWVDLRWIGESNGYYSESVSFTELDKPTLH